MAQGYTKGIPISTDPTMSANSNLVVPSQAAVVSYVASQIPLGGVTAVNAAAPVISSGGLTPTISMPAASGVQSGHLTNTDWTTFNNKLGSTLNNNQVFIGNASNVATPTTLSGDITNSAGVVTISNGAVSLAKMANLAANSIIGNNTGSPATPIALTATQVTAMLDLFSTTATTKGLVPGSNSLGNTYFLRADGTWAIPAGGSGITSLNGATAATQTLVTSSTGAFDFTISTVGSTHTFILPDASSAARGLVSTSGTQTFAGSKVFSSAPGFSTMTSGSILFAGTGGLLSQNNGQLFWNNTTTCLGNGTASPTSKEHIVAGTLVASTKQYALHVTATMPSTYSYLPQGVFFDITSAGTQTNASFPQRGLQVTLGAGYTGGTSTSTIVGTNSTVGTSTGIVVGGTPLGNSALLYAAIGNTTGNNYGAAGFARFGNISIGIVGRVGLNTTQDAKTGAKYIGVFGVARNNTGVGSVSLGGYFGLNISDPTFDNAALIADNADAAYPIFMARDNGTTKWSIEDGGNTTWADAVNMVFNTATGTKIGTATTQKIGFWNAAPIVQPTTAVAAATRVGGGGTTVTDTDTFDGYTIAQLVKALRNTGLLA